MICVYLAVYVVPYKNVSESLGANLAKHIVPSCSADFQMHLGLLMWTRPLEWIWTAAAESIGIAACKVLGCCL